MRRRRSFLGQASSKLAASQQCWRSFSVLSVVVLFLADLSGRVSESIRCRSCPWCHVRVVVPKKRKGTLLFSPGVGFNESSSLLRVRVRGESVVSIGVSSAREVSSVRRQALLPFVIKSLRLGAGLACWLSCLLLLWNTVKFSTHCERASEASERKIFGVSRVVGIIIEAFHRLPRTGTLSLSLSGGVETRIKYYSRECPWSLGRKKLNFFPFRDFKKWEKFSRERTLRAKEGRIPAGIFRRGEGC